MSFCPFFKNGYFAVCAASGSNHVPSIAEMEQYCFKENFLCPAFDLYTTRNSFSDHNGIRPVGIPLSAQSPEK
jgi:hypothetical protein